MPTACSRRSGSLTFSSRAGGERELKVLQRSARLLLGREIGRHHQLARQLAFFDQVDDLIDILKLDRPSCLEPLLELRFQRQTGHAAAIERQRSGGLNVARSRSPQPR